MGSRWQAVPDTREADCSEVREKRGTGEREKRGAACEGDWIL